MTVDTASPGATASAHGRTYVFCSQGCADTFTADPARQLPAAEVDDRAGAR